MYYPYVLNHNVHVTVTSCGFVSQNKAIYRDNDCDQNASSFCRTFSPTVSEGARDAI